MLTVTGLGTGYGKKQVLHEIDLRVDAGEVVALIGPNGSGKSTVLKAVAGWLPCWEGSICIDGLDTQGLNPTTLPRTGVAFLAQHHRVFSDLTVLDNLRMGGYTLPRATRSQRITDILDRHEMLKSRVHRKAGTLSGGEQQMLALARVLMLEPRLLLIDEPSLGLAPHLLTDMFDRILELRQTMNLGILIVEQRVREILPRCDRYHVLKGGRIVSNGRTTAAENAEEVVSTFF